MGNIGENIMRLRKERGLTQEELANRMGYKSKSTINKIELGINDIPQSKIVKFAEVLGVTPAKIMGWHDEIQNNPKETAERHADIVTDKDIFEIYDDFKLLDKAQRQIVKDLIRNLAATKKEA